MKNRTYLLLLLILWIPLGLRARTAKVWEGTPVRAASVTLTEYLPEGEPLAAVVVCPGGSYFWLDKEGEGSLVAGGHLVMSAGEFFGTDFTGLGLETSLRPDFVAPIYPVVSMREPCTHARSRRGLLGDGRTGQQALRDSLSLECHVRPDTPPVFLLCCDDDPVVDPRNSDLLDAALTEKGVPHRYVRYHAGGHGFGADREKFTEETARWQAAFLDWLKEIDYGH